MVMQRLQSVLREIAPSMATRIDQMRGRPSVNPNVLEEAGLTIRVRQGELYWRIIRQLPDGTFNIRPIYERGKFDRFGIPPRLRDVPAADVTPLFEALNIQVPFPIIIQEELGSYVYDQNPKNNWVYAAIRGFQELKRKIDSEGKKCTTFCSAGVGPGIDLVGAHYVLDPEFFTYTDVSRDAIAMAGVNLRNNVAPGRFSGANGLHTNLLEGAINNMDVIYANIPNIPANEVQTEHSMAPATFVSKDAIQGAPKVLDDYLLAHQWHLLSQAKEKLSPGGSVVIALGGRIPYEYIEQMFSELGYRMEGLFSTVKMQTQPADVISGYAQAENANNIDFTFYDMEKLVSAFPDEDAREGAAQNTESERYRPFALTATQALEMHKKGKPIGHLVYILRGVLD